MKEQKESDSDQHNARRIVTVDPGLLTPEELLAQYKDRKTLRELVRKQNQPGSNRYNLASLIIALEKYVRNFLDNAQIRISVSEQEIIYTMTNE